MKRFAQMLFSVLAACTAAFLVGCEPEDLGGQAAEEREPYYVEGRKRVNSYDFKGAIESFEKALESNPRSASAHFWLGWLFNQKEGNPAASIYHYEKYLKLRPKAENEDIVRQHILACKQELARTVSLGPINDKVQQDLERMVQENRSLQETNKALLDEALRWRTYFASAKPPATNSSAGASQQKGDLDPSSRKSRNNNTSQNSRTTPSTPAAGSSSPGRDSAYPQSSQRTPGYTRPPTTSSYYPPRSTTTYGYGRTHQVRSGETLNSIARLYGTRVSSLVAANPGLDAKRLRAGQVLKIP